MFAICVFTLLFSAAVANDMKFEYQISEGRARFTEKIKANLERNTVTYYTPPHNNVVESYKMMAFDKQMQLTCLPSLRQCRVRDIDVKELSEDPGTVVESFLHSWNKGENSIDSAQSKRIDEMYYIDDETVENTVQLGEDLRKFYEEYGKDENGGFLLYKEKKLPANAVLLNITTSDNKRDRRAVVTLNTGCRGQTPVQKFGINTSKSCNYLKICKNVVSVRGRNVFADCDNQHINSPFVYRCVCCPYVTTIHPNNGECACAKMG